MSKIQNTFKDANLALGVDDVSIYFLAHISSRKSCRWRYATGRDAGDGERGHICLSERSDELREVFAGTHLSLRIPCPSYRLSHSQVTNKLHATNLFRASICLVQVQMIENVGCLTKSRARLLAISRRHDTPNKVLALQRAQGRF